MAEVSSKRSFPNIFQYLQALANIISWFFSFGGHQCCSKAYYFPPIKKESFSECTLKIWLMKLIQRWKIMNLLNCLLYFNCLYILTTNWTKEILSVNSWFLVTWKGLRATPSLLIYFFSKVLGIWDVRPVVRTLRVPQATLTFLLDSDNCLVLWLPERCHLNENYFSKAQWQRRNWKP